MANLLDLNLIGFLAPALVFIFFWVVTYAILSKVKIFGDNKGVNLTIAFTVALLVLINVKITRVITAFIPWVFGFFILLLFIYVLFMFFGVDEKFLSGLIKNETTIWVPVLSIIVIMFLFALTVVFGPFLQVTDQPGFWETVKRTVFHPRVLGAIFIIIVASSLIRVFEIGKIVK